MNKMLSDSPKISSSIELRRNNTVFINPNFKAAAPHINPKFFVAPLQQKIQDKSLQSTEQSKIHINPQFLQNLKEGSSRNTFSDLSPATGTKEFNLENTVVAKVISKSKTKLIRQPAPIASISSTTTLLLPKKIPNIDQLRTAPITKIGHRKLIRISNIVNNDKVQSIENLQNTKPIVNISNSKGKYKIDRRISQKPSEDEKKKITYNSRYALKRSNVSPIKRSLVTKRKIVRSSLTIGSILTKKENYSNASVHKKLELLNINGVLYKSTRNKLQRNDTPNQINLKTNITKPFKDSARNSTVKKANGDRILFVRGNKFVLDKNGFKLTRSIKSSELVSEKPNNFKRIDIGGLTYIAKSNNVFIRTDTHVTRNHLSTAKNKSINVLTNRLVKSNIPCQIYRKLGKCAGFEKGKCPKVHDKSQISICTKFIRGECNNKNCLLSHNLSLSKMPVCKFFLQGLCSREDCPYLHKKLSKNAEICLDFLKGFCKLAEKCNKRHEYLCPDYVSKGKCDKIKCLYCTKRDSLKKLFNDKSIKIKENNINCEIVKDNIGNNNISESKEKTNASRYFLDDSSNDSNKSEKLIKNDEIDDALEIKSSNDDSDNDCININKNQSLRPKLGALPSFIPL